MRINQALYFWRDKLGFAKYHEDDLKIYDERMYYRNDNSLACIQTNYVRPSRIEYKYFCPFCNSGFLKNNELVNHIMLSHGGVHEFV